MPLLENTQKLLDRAITRGATLNEIVAAAEGAIGFEWLKKFKAGDIDHPSVVRIQSLHDCLKTVISNRS